MHDDDPAPRRRRGRPSVYVHSPTAWGRWIEGQGMTMQQARDGLLAAAEELGYPPGVVPSLKTLYEHRNLNAPPGLLQVHLIEHATGGAVALRDWVPSPEVAWKVEAALTTGDHATAREEASGRAARRS